MYEQKKKKTIRTKNRKEYTKEWTAHNRIVLHASESEIMGEKSKKLVGKWKCRKRGKGKSEEMEKGRKKKNLELGCVHVPLRLRGRRRKP